MTIADVSNAAVGAVPPAPTLPTQRMDKAAHQFEAMLLQELLKPLTASEDDGNGDSGEGSLGGSSTSGPLESFGTQAVAESLANSGALGFARQIERSLQHRAGASQTGGLSVETRAEETVPEKNSHAS